MRGIVHATLVALGFISFGLLSGCAAVSSSSQQQPPVITTTSLPNGVVGTPYMQTILATGGVGPFGWAVSVGTLPHGLTLNSSVTNSVTISGTPDVQQTAAFSIKVTDSTNQSASQPYTVTIAAAPVSVSVSPTSTSVVINNTRQFVATVQNDPAAKGVTWALAQGGASCSPGCGTLSTANSVSGTPITYTAPATAPANPTVSLTATSVTDTSKSATATIVPTNSAITVSVAPPSALVAPGSNGFDIFADVANDPTGGGVMWSVFPSTGGGVVSTATSPSGISDYYTPPTAIPSTSLSVTLTATSVTDPSKSATVAVTVTTAIFLSVRGGSFIQVGGTVPFKATITNDIHAAGVTWSITGCTGGATVCGAFANANNSALTADYVAPATVPPGGKVSVTATSVTDPTKSATAMVTISPINFASLNYPAGNTPEGVAVADFNGDGHLDIAVVDYGNPAIGDNGGVSILLGNGDGTFQAATLISAGKNPIWIAVGDFNGDGRKDLVVSDFANRQTGGSGSVSVLLGHGDGTFQTPVTLSAGNLPFAVAVGDFNSDGKLDFMVSDVNRGVFLFLGNGDGSFQTPTIVGAGTNPAAIAVADLNGDGKLDLAVGNQQDPSGSFNGGVSVLLGNGDGTFKTPVFYAVADFPTSLAIGDLNGDGKPDLAISSFAAAFGLEGSALNVLLGNGDGTFKADMATGTGHSITGNGFALSVVIADFASSGKQDIAEIVGPPVNVLPGRGDGTFLGQLFFSAGGGPFQLAVGDFNGDGKPDIVVADTSGNGITILLNASVP
jgi:hypothetical protein